MQSNNQMDSSVSGAWIVHHAHKIEETGSGGGDRQYPKSW